ncbi:LOW QUALITY PROTEIN: putative neuroblastoma breakpoint family member 5 [Carlito syrichta]|uniref:LOW QUALITY PROTEIN: putative neuroblastoma breakpoint family member 5 n=1 Tax=Carlito syrichta TaxID=1868482 RepID=A0A3Q0E8H0_CARSF|nr:LOW QUALITY PROTEIN: putative neuroblastoma breakpoint family member 5 [Carlito syrichta]
MCLGFFSSVPVLSTSSATMNSMAVSVISLARQRAKANFTGNKKELNAELVNTKQQLRDLKEKLLISEPTVYTLANQLQQYKCEEYKDLLESVLGEELQFLEGEPVQKPRQAEELRDYRFLIKTQAKELTQLRDKLPDGRDASFSLFEHLKLLLSHGDPDDYQRENLREPLAEGFRLAKCLICKLRPENEDDEEVEDTPSWLSTVLRETEEKKDHQDSMEECSSTCSICYDLSDSDHHHSNCKSPSKKQEVDSSVDVNSEHSHYQGEEALNILTDNPNDHEKHEGQQSVASRKLQESEEKKVLQDSQEECFLTSSHHDLPESHQPCASTSFESEKWEICSAQDVTSEYPTSNGYNTPTGFSGNLNDAKGLEDQVQAFTRLNGELAEMQVNECPQESLSGCYLTPSIFPDPLSCHHFCKSSPNSVDRQQVGLALNVGQILDDHWEEEDQDPPCPRLSRDLPEVEEQDGPSDSLDERYLIPSIHHDLSDSHQPDSSTLYSSEEQQACSSPDVPWFLLSVGYPGALVKL